jgi:hypothetical protein
VSLFVREGENLPKKRDQFRDKLRRWRQGRKAGKAKGVSFHGKGGKGGKGTRCTCPISSPCGKLIRQQAITGCVRTGKPMLHALYLHPAKVVQPAQLSSPALLERLASWSLLQFQMVWHASSALRLIMVW